MQDVNRLNIMLVEQEMGGIHDVDNIVEGTQQMVIRSNSCDLKIMTSLWMAW